MAEIVFEELPGGRAARTAWAREAAQALRDNPGAWARVKTHEKPATASAAASAIKTGAHAAWQPAGAFEAAVRKVDGEFRVYARYVGEV